MPKKDSVKKREFSLSFLVRNYKNKKIENPLTSGEYKISNKKD